MSVWEDLLEVIVVGGLAGIGLSIAFAFAIRGVVQAGAARREGRTRATAGYVALTTVAGAVCIAAVVFAIVTMIHK